MKTYIDIIIRIKEILEESARIKDNIPEEEKEENYNKYFVKLLFTDIAIPYASEFRKLLDQERTHYYMLNDKNHMDKNQSLITTIEEKKTSDERNKDAYERLIQILKNVNNIPTIELVEYKGFIVKKEELNTFINFGKLLKIDSAFLPFNRWDDEYKKNKMYADSEQLKRIKYYISEMNNRESLKDSKKEYRTISEEVDKQITEEAINGYSIISGPYKELVNLGITGKLSPEIITSLRRILPNNIYNELVDTLVAYNVFSMEEINKVNKESVRDIKSVEDLVAFFATRKILT